MKRDYFRLIRQGMRGAEAARRVGVSVSCGSKWFVDSGEVNFIDVPIDPRFMSQDDRIRIADGLACGESVKQIAADIGKSFQSVYKEIARNRRPDGTYQPFSAHSQAWLRRRRPKRHIIELNPRLARLIGELLDMRWSPQQISRHLRRKYPHRPGWHLCHETIYEAVYRGRVRVSNATDQVSTLRTGRTYRHKRGRGRNRDGALRQCTTIRSIHDRPVQAQRRVRCGHWEGDLIIGSGKTAIATLVDRKSRYTILVPLPDGHTAPKVAAAISAAFQELPPGLRKTLTWDQGNEMFAHPQIEQATGLRIYFADPHSPWQRPTNENTNGLLRQYFPKSTDLSVHPAQHLAKVAAELNQRPRLVIGDRTPAQVMKQSTSHMKHRPIRFVR
jgi:IS30 family transposase